MKSWILKKRVLLWKCICQGILLSLITLQDCNSKNFAVTVLGFFIDIFCANVRAEHIKSFNFLGKPGELAITMKFFILPRKTSFGDKRKF